MNPVIASTNIESPKMVLAGVVVGEKMLVELSGEVAG